MSPKFLCFYKLAKSGPLSFDQLTFAGLQSNNYSRGTILDALDELIKLNRIKTIDNNKDHIFFYCLKNAEWNILRKEKWLRFEGEEAQIFG